MRAYQGESVFLVQFGDIIYQPGFRSVTTGAIVAYRLTVHILMAGNTFHRSFTKDQGGVA